MIHMLGRPGRDGPLRVGIVGTGFAATSHADALARLPGVRLLGVAGTSQDKAEAVAARLGAERAYPGYRALLDDPDIDAVHDCTPNHLHAEVNSAAMAAGKHVLSEKPLAMDSHQTAALARVPGAVLVTGAAGERVDDRHLKQFGKLHRGPPCLVRIPRDLGFRVQWVAVLAQRADEQAPLLNGLPEPHRRARVIQQFLRPAVRVPGVVAGPDLHRLGAHRGQLVQRLLERKLLVQDREHTEFHSPAPLSVVSPTCPQPPRRWLCSTASTMRSTGWALPNVANDPWYGSPRSRAAAAA